MQRGSPKGQGGACIHLEDHEAVAAQSCLARRAHVSEEMFKRTLQLIAKAEYGKIHFATSQHDAPDNHPDYSRSARAR